MTYIFQATSTFSLPAWIQAGAALLAFGVTIWLAIITQKYVTIAGASLQLSQEQFAASQRVYAEFGLRNAEQGGFEVWVVNLGTANFLVTAIHARPAEGSADNVRNLKLNNTVIAGEAGSRFALPDHFTADDSWTDTRCIDISLSCVSSAERKQTKWRVFSLVKEEAMWRVYAGFKGPLPVSCPICVEYTGIKMKTDDLEDLDAAWARRREMQKDLESSHPKHQSEWLNQ